MPLVNRAEWQVSMIEAFLMEYPYTESLEGRI
jgi:hypothetical protein